MTAPATETTLDKERKRAEIAKLTVETEYERLKLEGYRRRIEAEAADSQYNRLYTFYAMVSASSVYGCMKEVGVWARQSSEPITIVFNSPGGSVIDGLALYDFLRHLSATGIHITTIGLGMVASMGGVLLQAGDHRILGANASLLIHEASTGAGGKVSELEDEVAFVKRLQERLLDILASRSKMTKAEIKRRWNRRDWWLEADDALRRGFCDEVRAG